MEGERLFFTILRQLEDFFIVFFDIWSITGRLFSCDGIPILKEEEGDTNPFGTCLNIRTRFAIPPIPFTLRLLLLVEKLFLDREVSFSFLLP